MTLSLCQAHISIELCVAAIFHSGYIPNYYYAWWGYNLTDIALHVGA